VTQAGVVTTIAGQAGAPGTSDGSGAAARFTRPSPAIDCAPGGDIVIGDGGRLRHVTASGLVTTLAVSVSETTAIDGPLGSAGFALDLITARSPTDVVFSDYLQVRRVKDGTVATLAGVTPSLFYQAEPTLYGYAVALAGNRAVVTAPRATTPYGTATRSGMAWVFEFDGTSWSAGTPIWAPAASATERVGQAVAMGANGDLVLGGANGCTWVAPGVCSDDSVGTPIEAAVTPVRVFRPLAGRWSEIMQLTRSDTVIRTGFGSTLASGVGVVNAGVPGGNLYPTDTSGDVIVFEVSLLDSDGDTLPDDWEMQYGLDPASPVGANGAAGDPDGDGLTNAKEYAAQSHPTNLASATRYLAEGATGFFETGISIANPGSSTAHALLRFLQGSGLVTSHGVTVPSGQSRKIPVSRLPDLASAEFSTVIESDEPVVVDRQMRWDALTAYGTHAEASVSAPALTWYFSEGATHSGFDLFYLLQNPGDIDAQVRVRFLRPSGSPIEKVYTVRGRSRANIWVDVEEFPAGSGQRLLEATDVSAVIEVTNNVPIIAERAMYLNAGTTFEAGHESAGVTAPATNWFLAEGATGPYFDLFVLLANPSPTTDALVRAVYLLPDGTTHAKHYTVPANSRANIWVDIETFPDGHGGETAALADTAVSTTLTVLNGVPIIVERSMWWPGPTAATWAEAHNSFGSTETATRWGFADGAVFGPPSNTETYLLIANTATTVARVKVTLLFDDGGAAVSREYDVLGQSRFNVPVRVDFPQAIGRGFGAIVESIGPTPAPIVVERAMYSDANGVAWRAGSNALGTRLP
jgi:hypothetical protein